jgi:cAMP-dependent protein kinase regulator
MRAPPPAPDGATISLESPTDRALALLLAGDREAALRLAGGELARDDAGAAAALITGRLLGEMGRAAQAGEALELALITAIDRGDLPLACVTARELGRAGGDEAGALDRIAAAFCQGSPRARGAGSPPPMPQGHPAPLSDALTSAALLDAAASAARSAKARIEARTRPAVAPVPLFSSLAREALRGFLAAWEPQWLAASSTVIEEGVAGAEAYVIARGEADVRRGSGAAEGVLARLGRGAIFGEMALLARAPRAASVITRGPAIVLRIARAALDAAADRHPDVGVELARHCRARMIENLLRESPVLAVVPEADRPALLERFETRIFEARERLITQDEISPGLYVIASGKVAVVRREAGEPEPLVLAQLGPGDVVGEVALVLRRRPGADVYASEPVVSLFLPASGFLGLIHDHPAMLAELYLLAAARDEETSNVISQEATAAEDFILV